MTSEGVKRCKTCGAEKPPADFYRNRGARESSHAECKLCLCARSRGWRRKNRERAQARDRRYKLQSTYSLTPEDYDTLVDQQRGVCAVCREPCVSGNRLAVDHSHSTGSVRGLLCVNCNRGIGLFKDDPGRLRCAAVYLETPRPH